MKFFYYILFLLPSIVWGEAVKVAESEKSGVAFFDQHIHPVFESSCFECHGGEKVSGGLVLSNRQSLIKGGNRGPGLNLKDPENSILLQMINHPDSKLQMPFQKQPLSQDQKDKFKEWVMMGAPYNPSREFVPKAADGMIIDEKARSYWAYTPPVKPPVPDIKSDFIKNSIDAFVLDRLNKEGIKPNSSAELEKLVRRVYYDLTGLAPTAEELKAFVGSYKSDQDWANLVDRLLDSKEFGEKMASHWLDLVRYSETNGFERDSNKPFMWRYRDYVIQSFNQNKPYDQFVLEQLAGDEIKPKTTDSLIATGYLTLMQRDDEPADRLQAHADMVGDMVDVTAEAFLGSTMGCAKCHDHKGDPIRQSDYYSMMSFFDGVREDFLKEAIHSIANEKDKEEHERRVEKAKIKKDEVWSSVDKSLIDSYIQNTNNAKAIIKMSIEEPQDWQIAYRKPLKATWKLPSYNGEELELKKAPYITKNIAPVLGYHSSNSSIIDNPKLLVLRKNFGLQSIPESFYLYFNTNLKGRLDIYINGENIQGGSLTKVEKGKHYYAFTKSDLDKVTTGKNTIALVLNHDGSDLFFDAGLYLEPRLNLSPDTLVSQDPELIEKIYGKEQYQQLHEAVKFYEETQKKPVGMQIMGVQEVKDIPTPKIHIRGNVHAEGIEVPIAFPAVMVSPDQSNIPKLDTSFFDRNTTHGRRLALAQWITDEKNPLAARVMVNRLWQYGFGIGIVPSANDFGKLGESPSNQALLDYLAVEFMESNWNIKHMLRLIFNSSTYRLSTEYNEKSFEADPNNRLLWRNNARRFTAEEIRDTFLAIAGKLNLKKEGMWVLPKMPKEVLATSSQPYEVWPQTFGSEANRRSIYVHVKRSMKLPILTAYDAAERDMSCATRFATTVPTQALTMLNSEFVNECAKQFASRAMKSSNDLNEQISEAFKLALSRSPEGEELQELRNLYNDLITTYQLQNKVALERLCLVILNMNETIYLD